MFAFSSSMAAFTARQAARVQQQAEEQKRAAHADDVEMSPAEEMALVAAAWSRNEKLLVSFPAFLTVPHCRE